jgi:hypothetical protein
MSNNCKAMCFDREGRSYEPASVLLARIKSQSQYKRGPGGIDRIQDLQKK